jgi:predicted metalloprotease with PDZ domain
LKVSKSTRSQAHRVSTFGCELALVAMLCSSLLLAQTASRETYRGAISVAVDASQADARIFHARLLIPVAPGPLTLMYAKWVPGEHAPSGPVQDLTGLRFTAGHGEPNSSAENQPAQALPWRRDDVDMYAIHLEVPDHVDQLQVTLDYTSPVQTEQGFTAGTAATAQLAVLNWNWLLLYPKGYRPDEITCNAKLRIPPGWQFGTALPVASQSGEQIVFQPVSLYTLVDSPVITGRFLRKVNLTPAGASAPAEMDIAADSPAALEISPELERNYRQLVTETTTLFGATHYRSYHFLLTLSDHVAHFGLEHHESNDSRTRERSLIDPQKRLLMASLLPHEYVHSWNGKFRRPAGLATPDYEQPMKGELLWVYEGLTEYLGDLLSARSGLRTPEQFRDVLALHAAVVDRRSGRIWRPLLDTAIAAQVLYGAPQPWTNWRRSVDFYEEGELIWLEVDATIRSLTHGRKSLDDFCKLFAGPPSLAASQVPGVKPYTFDDIVNILNQLAANDWRKFFLDRLSSTAPRAPLGGIETAGWSLTYSETPSELFSAYEAAAKQTDLTYSLGLLVNNEDGKIVDVRFESAAAKAGVAPGMTLVAVNGRAFAPEVMHDALKAAKTGTEPLELLLRNDTYYRTVRMSYHGGDRYPQLIRNSRPDMLSEIIKQRVPRATNIAATERKRKPALRAQSVQLDWDRSDGLLTIH